MPADYPPSPGLSRGKVRIKVPAAFSSPEWCPVASDILSGDEITMGPLSGCRSGRNVPREQMVAAAGRYGLSPWYSVYPAQPRKLPYWRNAQRQEQAGIRVSLDG